MPLFGKKKDKDAKKQEAAPEAKPAAAYRHVPKHAASDSRNNNGLAEEDREAQKKRIMAASRERLTSRNSNYSVKSGFTDVPLSHSRSQSKQYLFTASNSNSPRHTFASAKGKDRLAVQPAAPATSTPASREAQEEYLKLRNPSFLSHVTFPQDATPRPGPSTKHQYSQSGNIPSTDSGYGGSVGQISRPDSKAPSTISQAPSEARLSPDVKTAPQTSSSGLDFLPKLDFNPDSARAVSPPESSSSAQNASRNSTSTTTRDRALSSASSSYVSRLDPGSDRRSIVSTSSKPFDQIDFSKPGQQFIPPSSPANNRGSVELNPSYRSSLYSERSPRLSLQEPRREERQPQVVPIEPRSNTQTAYQADRTRDFAQPAERSAIKNEPKSSLPDSTREIWRQAEANEIKDEPQAEPEVSRESSQRTVQAAAPPSAAVDAQQGDDSPTLQPTSDEMMSKAPSYPPSIQEEPHDETPTVQQRNVDWDSARTVVEERGAQVEQPTAATSAAAETISRKSSEQATYSEQSKPRTGRHRNWSRPSQTSGSKVENDRWEHNGESFGGSEHTPSLTSQERNDHLETSRSRDTEPETRDFGRSEPIPPSSHVIPAEQVPLAQTQQPRWNDQASSVYGDSLYGASTRQHSPARRPSYAPSEILDARHLNERAALPPLSILDGLKVNKRGKILDEEGDVIGELIDGDIIDCVRQKANAFGQVQDEYGRIVGWVTTTGRGGGGRSGSPATTMRSQRSQAFPDFQPDPMQRYMAAEPQMVSPVTSTLGRPFEYTQQEDPRQRAIMLEAAAARRSIREPDTHIELDGSGYAEAAPLLDHSEIFAPPFIPSRSPKRSPAEPERATMDSYFVKPPEMKQPPVEEGKRVKKWASRNLEQDREEMQRSNTTTTVPAPAQPLTKPPSEHSISRPSTMGETASNPSAPSSNTSNSESDNTAQNFISSDQPRDIFPWMTAQPPPQDTGKWSPTVFTYKGDVPSEDSDRRQSSSTVRSAPAKPQNPTLFASNGMMAKHLQYASHLAANGGTSRKSNRTSFREHQPHVKSPLSTHNSLPADASAETPTSDLLDSNTPTPRPSTRQATTTATSSTSTPAPNTASSTAEGPKRTKTYFTHHGRKSVMVTDPDTTPTHTSPAASAAAKKAAAAEPPSPQDSAMAPDVARTKVEKKKSRWSLGVAGFGRKTAPPVQNLLKKP